MANELAIPQCFIEIYPYEGGVFNIQNNYLRKCDVSKNIRADEGTFELILSPGGPNGTVRGPQWLEILTVNSFCMIGLTRWQYRQIVMLGIVTNVREIDVWKNDEVERLTLVEGLDFSYFFRSFNFYNLTFLGTTLASAIGNVVGSVAALPAILSDGLLQGPPDQVASRWYNVVMAQGKNPTQSGILANTTVPYGSQRVKFPDAMGQFFQPMPGFVIPMADYSMATEGTWTQKFKNILMYPWWEFFIQTAPSGFYPTAENPTASSASNVSLGQPVIHGQTATFTPGTGGALDEVTVTSSTPVSAGTQFTMRALGTQFPATPYVVGRINPLPRMQVNVAGENVTFGQLDMSRWNALPLFVPDASYIDSMVGFSTDEVRNFYVLNPTWFKTLFGDNNSFLNQFLFSFTGCLDAASIQRYGFHPEIVATPWFVDADGKFAQSGQTDIFNLAAQLICWIFSYHEPSPLMAKAVVEINLRPDIMPGCRYQYVPFKGGEPWTFYIEGVSHSFVFGERATTKLTLTRGLPTRIYSDPSSNGVLYEMHLGNASRFQGDYVVGLPGSTEQGLTIFGLGSKNNINAALSHLAGIWNSPQS